MCQWLTFILIYFHFSTIIGAENCRWNWDWTNWEWHTCVLPVLHWSEMERREYYLPVQVCTPILDWSEMERRKNNKPVQVCYLSWIEVRWKAERMTYLYRYVHLLWHHNHHCSHICRIQLCFYIDLVDTHSDQQNIHRYLYYQTRQHVQTVSEIKHVFPYNTISQKTEDLSHQWTNWKKMYTSKN